MIKEEDQNIKGKISVFPTKPNPNNNLRPDLVDVYANLLKVKFEPNTNSRKVFLYSIQTFPVLEVNSPIIKKIIFAALTSLKSTFQEAYRVIGLNLFSPIELDEVNIKTSIRERSLSSEIHSSDNNSNHNNSCGSGTGSKSSVLQEYSLIIKPTGRFFDISKFSDSNYVMNNLKEVQTMKMFLEQILKSCLYSNENIVKFQNGQFFDRRAPHQFSDNLRCKNNYIMINLYYL